MVESPKGLGPEKDCAGKSPLVREGAPQKQDPNCQTVINIWSRAPDGARHQDLVTDWPSVAMWLWLDQSVFRVLGVAPTRAERSSHPTKGTEDFTETSGASNSNSDVVNDCTCKCRRDWPINIFAKSETRVNFLVALRRQHATVYTSAICSTSVDPLGIHVC
jgi:hypothetical protein